jgi:hypothetical protein
MIIHGNYKAKIFSKNTKYKKIRTTLEKNLITKEDKRGNKEQKDFKNKKTMK